MIIMQLLIIIQSEKVQQEHTAAFILLSSEHTQAAELQQQTHRIAVEQLKQEYVSAAELLKTHHQQTVSQMQKEKTDLEQHMIEEITKVPL